MNSQDFFHLILIIAGFFVVWYLASWNQKKPTKLNLKAKDSAPIVMDPPKPAEEAPKPAPATSSLSTREAKPKPLNVLFIYNGHSWDAYEVLGVPAGASLPAVTAAYQSAVLKSDAASIPFFEAAYKAILSKN